MLMDPSPKDDGLKKLKFLSLISKVYTDLETHLGFGDKTLAEFIIYLGWKCETVDEFDVKLKQDGTEMPNYFVQMLLMTIHAILSSKPKAKKDSKKESASDGPKHSMLVISGNRDRIRRYQLDKLELFKVYKGRVSRVMDTSCFVQLNALKGKEGLVHVLQIATRRIGNAKDLVKCDQEVYTKVILGPVCTDRFVDGAEEVGEQSERDDGGVHWEEDDYVWLGLLRGV